MITQEGLEDFMKIGFTSANKFTPWYIGLISNVGWTGISTTDSATLGHSGWTEATSYLEESRDGDGPDGASTFGIFGTQSVNNIGRGEFDITFDTPVTTLRGFFLINRESFASTTGIIFSVNEFPDPIDLLPWESLEAFYRVKLAKP